MAYCEVEPGVRLDYEDGAAEVPWTGLSVGGRSVTGRSKAVALPVAARRHSRRSPDSMNFR